MMRIYINSKFEIKAINNTTDKTLTEIEVDRENVFGNMSDFMILNHCYKQNENGYSVYSLKEYTMLEMLDGTDKKISILQQENEKLKESQATQDMDIMFTQEAVDFLMLGSMSTNLKNIKLGGSNMAGYIATRIMKKGDISVEAGRNYYVTFLTHQDYAKYRAEVDLILISEGRENLIVDLTNL